MDAAARHVTVYAINDGRRATAVDPTRRGCEKLVNRGGHTMAEAAAASEENKGPRPIIPFLVLDDPPYLAGVRCTHCGATYLRSGRVACAKCSEAGPFEDIKLSD